MSSQAIRLTSLHYDVERALGTELDKRNPDPLRIFRLRRLKQLLRHRFARLFARG